jgi:hypothetical protein
MTTKFVYGTSPPFPGVAIRFFDNYQMFQDSGTQHRVIARVNAGRHVRATYIATDTKSVSGFFDTPRFIRVNYQTTHADTLQILCGIADVGYVDVNTGVIDNERAALAIVDPSGHWVASGYDSNLLAMVSQASGTPLQATGSFLLKFDPNHVDSDSDTLLMIDSGTDILVHELDMSVFDGAEPLSVVLGFKHLGISPDACSLGVAFDFLNPGPYDVGTAIGWDE